MKKVHLMVLALGLFVFASCGGDKPAEEQEATTQDSTEMTETKPEETVEETKPSVVALAMADENLSTLVAAVKAAELVETLEGEGPFTVFAPTNAAFEALPEGTLEELLKPENKEKLQSILTYHVVSGKTMSADLQDGMTAPTAQGQEIMISMSEEGAKVNGAMIVTKDIEAANGVVHVIDAVIMPKMEEAK